MGCMMRASAGWWCLQGGVLSSLLWSLMANGTLVWLSKEGLFVQGYSDDLGLVDNQRNSKYCFRAHALSLNIVRRWFWAKELSVVPDDKMKPVPFTGKRR
jgi:hypothetical protein